MGETALVRRRCQKQTRAAAAKRHYAVVDEGSDFTAAACEGGAVSNGGVGGQEATADIDNGFKSGCPASAGDPGSSTQRSRAGE